MVSKETYKWFGGKNTTHLLLDGGTLTVSDSDENDFYSAYVNDITKGKRLCIVEKKTSPNFKFFVDIDYVSKDETLVPNIKKLVETLANILIDLGPCAIACADPRQVKNGIKYGIHIIWYESIVDKHTANGLRLRLLNELGFDEWDKVIDSSVYAGSGLRMLWSFKNEFGSTPYLPRGTCTNGSYTEFSEKDPSVALLKLFSIRTHSSAPIPIYSSYNELEEYIRKNLPGQNSARILKVNKCKKINGYWVSTSSCYCENVKREHKSNHVWFNIIPNKNSPFSSIVQRCQDDECRNFKGRAYRIPSRLIPNEGVLDTRPHCTIYDYFPNGWK